MVDRQDIYFRRFNKKQYRILEKEEINKGNNVKIGSHSIFPVPDFLRLLFT